MVFVEHQECVRFCLGAGKAYHKTKRKNGLLAHDEIIRGTYETILCSLHQDSNKKVQKSNYTNLWTYFKDVKNLLDQNGFSWDDTKQMVLASVKYTSFWFTFWFDLMFTFRFDLYLWGDSELT